MHRLFYLTKTILSLFHFFVNTFID
jgi:hypothetical protein